MPLINLPISSQIFEIVRDRLAQILAVEIDNQGTLTYDPYLLEMKVFVESANAADKTEFPFINVSLAKGTFGDLKLQNGQTKGVYIFNIDVYTNSKQNSTTRGDKLSAIALHRVLAVSRVILDHWVFKKLSFPPGIIYSVNTREINIRENDKNDALNTSMGRITLEVVAQESDMIPDGIPLTSSNTEVKLNETDEGYFYTVN